MSLATPRPNRHPAVSCCLAWALAAGCVPGVPRGEGGPRELDALGGQRVLAVAVPAAEESGTGDPGRLPAGAQARLEEALSPLPARWVPASADRAFRDELAAAGASAGEVSSARAMADRVPFVLRVGIGADGGPAAADLVSPFGPAPSWRWASEARVAAARWESLSRRLSAGLPPPVLGDGLAAAEALAGEGPFRPAPLGRVEEALLLVAAGHLADAVRAGEALRAEWARDPAGPAVLAWEGLLTGGAAAARDLARARDLVPGGESPLLRGAWLAAGLSSDAAREAETRAWGALRESYPDRADYGVGHGEALARAGRWAEAERALMSTPARDEPLPDGPAPGGAAERAALAVEGDRRHVLGTVLAERGRTDPSAASFGSAARLFARLEMRADAARSLNDLGVAYADAGRPAEALGPLRQALDVRGTLGSGEEVATTRFNLGMAYAALGQDGLADDALTRAANGYGALGRDGDRLDTLVELIPVRGRRKSAPGVRIVVEEALRLAGDRSGDRGRVLEASALAHVDLDEAEAALAVLDEAAAAFRAAGDRPGEGRVAYDRAIPLVALGRHAEALAALDEARRFAEELDDRASLDTIADQVEAIRRLERHRAGAGAAPGP